MKEKNIHWFPGHMKKAAREMEERIRIVDVVIEILDARIPLSSQNTYFRQLSAHKKRLTILAKADLADPSATNKWLEAWQKEGEIVLALDLTNPKSDQEMSKALQVLGRTKWDRDARRGLKPQPLKTMIVGVPNVGKSTLINRLSRRRAASVQNTPGHTRSQQWIKVDQLFELLDTPGVLPTNYLDPEQALHIAWVGAIKETILPLEETADSLVAFLWRHEREKLQNRYQITNDNELSVLDILSQVAIRRGFMLNNHPDLDQARRTVWKEFRDGILGAITIERRPV